MSGVVGVLTTIGLLITYGRIAQRFPEAKKILLRTLILVVFLLGFCFVITLALIVRLYTALTRTHQTYTIWILHSVAIPVCHIIFPVGYLICFYSWSWFQWTTKKAARKNWKCCFVCHCKEVTTVHTHPKNRAVDFTADTCTHPESSRVSDLSYTYFNVPYTNEFTEVESEADQLLQTQTSRNDTLHSYGSTTTNKVTL